MRKPFGFSALKASPPFCWVFILIRIFATSEACQSVKNVRFLCLFIRFVFQLETFREKIFAYTVLNIQTKTIFQREIIFLFSFRYFFAMLGDKKKFTRCAVENTLLFYKRKKSKQNKPANMKRNEWHFSHTKKERKNYTKNIGKYIIQLKTFRA